MTAERSGRHSNIAIFVPHLGCPHRCSFCNQNTITGKTSVPRASDVAAACDKAILDGIDTKNTEIAFFGGSFTAVPRGYMLELLGAAKKYLDIGFKGIRLSTRPDAIDGEILDILGAHGVTSIELGAQSMSDEVLKLNERGHTARDVVNASEMIKERGFSLGLQMMVGLYGSMPETDYSTALALADLRPKEVRIYPTVILSGTALGELYSEGKYVPYTLEQAVELCSRLLDMFEDRGIDVIKLGLHASTDVESSMLAGIYHPAFRELCESRRMRREMEKYIASGDEKQISFTVRPDCLSQAIGHKKCNIEYFRENGIEVSISPSQGQNEKLLPAKSF